MFLAEKDVALKASRIIATQPLPAGLSVWPTSDDPESRQIKDAQVMMATAGLVPFSGSMLAGETSRSVTVIIGNENAVVAAAHGYMPHNEFSSYSGYAWGALVTVAEAHRGKGLDKRVNALVVQRAFRELGATHVYELCIGHEHSFATAGRGLRPKVGAVSDLRHCHAT